MARIELAELVEQHPGTAGDVFTRLDEALNAVLPGSDTHERYEGIQEVGLAVVVARDALRQSYSPLDPETPAKLSFMGDNRQEHLAAWELKDTDEAVIGGAIPAGIGRFTAYALAKINAMTGESNNDIASYSARQASIAPGKVGIAGGRWIMNSLVGVSGLWEVHDHLVAGIFADEMDKAAVTGTPLRTADELAADIEPLLASVKSLHSGTSAADLSRDEVARLLRAMNGMALSPPATVDSRV